MALNCCIYLRVQITLLRKNLLSLTLRGIARNALHTPHRAPPVAPSISLRISRVLAFEGDPRSLTLFCVFLFTFYLMVRLPNIVPKSAISFDPRRHLTRGCYFSWPLSYI